jgi:hypothetical protein
VVGLIGEGQVSSCLLNGRRVPDVDPRLHLPM